MASIFTNIGEDWFSTFPGVLCRERFRNAHGDSFTSGSSTVCLLENQGSVVKPTDSVVSSFPSTVFDSRWLRLPLPGDAYRFLGDFDGALFGDEAVGEQGIVRAFDINALGSSVEEVAGCDSEVLAGDDL